MGTECSIDKAVGTAICILLLVTREVRTVFHFCVFVGKGHFCFPDGSMQSGMWVRDMLEGPGEYTMAIAPDDASEEALPPATSEPRVTSLREEILVKKIINLYKDGEVNPKIKSKSEANKT